jgi:hypothetical protein
MQSSGGFRSIALRLDPIESVNAGGRHARRHRDHERDVAARRRCAQTGMVRRAAGIDRVEVDSGVIERKPLSRGIRCNSIEANDDF